MIDDLINEENQPSTSSMLDELLNKYGLQEDANKMYQKINAGDKPNKAVIGSLAKNLALARISEKDVYDSLQKKLSTTAETTQKILKDIKETLAPFIKKVEENREKITSPVTSRPPITQQKNDNENAILKSTPKKKTIDKKEETNVHSNMTPLEKSGGPDKYREQLG